MDFQRMANMAILRQQQQRKTQTVWSQSTKTSNPLLGFATVWCLEKVPNTFSLNGGLSSWWIPRQKVKIIITLNKSKKRDDFTCKKWVVWRIWIYWNGFRAYRGLHQLPPPPNWMQPIMDITRTPNQRLRKMEPANTPQKERRNIHPNHDFLGSSRESFGRCTIDF